MTANEAEKVCPLFLAASIANQEHSGKGLECEKGRCAWWVEAKKAYSDGTQQYIVLESARCGTAR